MSVSMESSGKSGSQDFDLNLAPIIDCLTVLIAFMLASTAFLSIGILDAGVAAAGASATSTTPPAISILIELGAGKDYLLKVTGKSAFTAPIPHTEQGWNGAELSKRLAALKTQWPDISAVTLSADNQVHYEDVVKSMETIRQTMPVVLLGGF
jgi:biopolymer transport protein ExbD